MRVARPASLFRHVADAVLVFAGFDDTISNEAEAFLEQLIEINTSRVERELQDRLADIRARLERKLRTLFTQASMSSRAMLARVTKARNDGELATGAEVRRIREMETAVRQVAATADRVGQG